MVAVIVFLSFPPPVRSDAHIEDFVIPPKPLTVDEKIRAIFPDAPIMLQIAYCESGNGCLAPINPQAKNPNSSASGVFQILKGTWADYGCIGDPFNEDDNIACARKIYDRSGLTPWNASRSSWGS